jgi:hypothetical protein
VAEQKRREAAAAVSLPIPLFHKHTNTYIVYTLSYKCAMNLFSSSEAKGRGGG